MTEEQKEKNRIRSREWYAANRFRALTNAQAYRLANLEKIKTSQANTYIKHRDKRRAGQLAWQKANPEQYQALKDKWARENPDKVKASIAKFHLANPAVKRDGCRLRRARKAELVGTFTQAQFIELCASYGNICLCCKLPKKLTADHVIPVTFGGANSIDNIQPLCQSCNCKKHTKSTDYRLNYEPISTKEDDASNN